VRAVTATAAAGEPVAAADTVDSASLAAYLAEVANQNASIADLISSKQLDIMRQCVNVSVRHADGAAGGEDSVRAICDRAQLAVGERVEVYLWTRWVGARVTGIEPGTDEVQLEVACAQGTVGEWWSASSAFEGGDTEGTLRIGGSDLEWHGSISTDGGITLGDQGKSAAITIVGSVTYPAFVGTREAGIVIKGASASATQRVRLRSDPSRSYFTQAVNGDSYHVQVDPDTLADMPLDKLRHRAQQEGVVPVADLEDKTEADFRILLLEHRREVASTELEFRFDVQSSSGELLIRAPDALISRTPVLVTGPAASGKSTLTKQCMHTLASTGASALSLTEDSDDWVAPYRVAVIDLSREIENEQWGPHDDILGEYIRRKEVKFASTLLAARERHRLVLILDGIDEAGSARAVLEPYIVDKLCREVFVCLAGRENGISEVARPDFQRFTAMHIEPLTPAQQRHIVDGRLSEMAAERTTSVEERIKGFMEQISRSSLEGLATTPMLLNLMLSEYMLHEGEGQQIRFDGRIVPGQAESVASFPGVEKRAWDRVTRVLQDKSVA
jgi:hypothetical protein